MEVFMGTIMAFGFNFAPRDWSQCQGQIVAIGGQSALFSLFGTMYGGNGRDTFGYPELRGRSPIGHGQQPGFPFYPQGAETGATNITLTHAQLPAHTHTHSYSGGGGGGGISIASQLEVAKRAGTKQTPDDGDYIAMPSDGFGTSAEGNLYVTPAEATAAGTAIAGGLTVVAAGEAGGFDNTRFAIASTGLSDMVNIQNPILAINYSVAIQGLYPPRS